MAWPDQNRLKAAEGWLELGNAREANEELERIAPDLRAHPAVLEVRWHLYAEATALKEVGMKGEAAVLTKQALLCNLDIASKLGYLDAEGLAEMRRGKVPTVRRWPYAGDQLSVDHIIPRSVCAELENVIANLELMPARMNSSEADKIGARQLDLARKLHSAGLLSPEGKHRVESSTLP